MLIASFASAQVAPVLYYDFDQTNPLAPRVGTGNLSTSGAYAIVPSEVGMGVAQLHKDSLTYSSIAGGLFVPTNAMSVQILFKAGYQFLNNRSAVIFEWGFASARFVIPSGANTNFLLRFSTRVNGVQNDQDIQLSGVNRGALQWYMDNKYHHLAFVCNGATGIKQIWVDGQLLGQSAATTGTVTPASDTKIYLNESTIYDQFYGSYDEAAFYTSALVPNQIYQNYLDFKAGAHYTTALAASLPSPDPITAAFNIDDYPLGYTLGSTTSANCTYSALQQLTRYASPRYPLKQSLRQNFNWVDPKYFGGYYQSNVADPKQESVNLQSILYTKYNYMLLVAQNLSTNVNYADTNTYEGKWVKLANNNPTWTRSAISFWSQINSATPSGNYVQSQTLPNNYYIRNSLGEFILTDFNGNITSTGTKTFSPAAPKPLISNDGVAVKTKLVGLRSALSSGRVDFVNENDEVFKLLDSTVMAQDPAVVADKVTSGLPYRAYYGKRQAEFSTMYRDSFMSLLPSALYTQYQIDGWDGTNGRNYYHSSFDQRKIINRTIGGRYYSTFDFYPRYPSNWRAWTSAFRGWQALDEARATEIGLGCKVYSPYVSAGWNANEESNQRPGRYLGELKCVGALGTDFFYAGFFNEGNFSTTTPPPHPKGYAWQMADVTYAQAILSRFDTTLKSGNYIRNMLADNTKPDSGYSMWAGDPRIWCVVRQDSINTKQYIITATIQPNSNQTDQVPTTIKGIIKLAGSYISFNVRPQGSVYFYNKDSAQFVQLDEWHEWKHPDRWTSDIAINAAVADTSSQGSSYRFVKTRTYTSAPNDYTSSTTCLSVRGAAAYTERFTYNVTPSITGAYRVYVRARSYQNNTAQQYKYIREGLDSVTVTLDVDSTWKWYYITSTQSMTANASYKHILQPLTQFAEIERILITTIDSTLLPKGGVCSSAPPVIYLTYTTPFCDSTTASVGATNIAYYNWSTGATTSSIKLYTTATTTITITDSLGCFNDTTFSVVKNNCDTTCNAPTNLKVNNIYRFSFGIRWSYSSPNLYGFQAKIINQTTGIITYSPVSLNTTNMRVTNLRPNNIYIVSVRSYCKIGSNFVWSDYCAPITVQTKP